MAEVLVARVALSRAVYAIDRPYSYLVPDELQETLRPGMRVMVPFGNGNQHTDGLVLTLERQILTAPLKQIAAALDETPVLDGNGLKLALWMRERYFCTVYDAVKAMLPAGLYFSFRDSVHVAEGIDREAAYQAAGRSEHARRLLDVLFANNGSADVEQLRLAFGAQNPMPALRQLTAEGVLTRETSAVRGVGDKTEQIARLALPAEEALAQAARRKKAAPLRYAVVELLASVGCASTKEIRYFTGASGVTLRSMEKSGVITLERVEVYRRPEIFAEEDPRPVTLNQEQEAACREITALLDSGKPSVSLLYGVTGSGKTEVYLALIRHVLEQGRSAMVLVPEIALTPQLLRRFTAHFGDLVAVLHSSLHAGERYDEWKRIRAGQARVAVGTRSAVFAPLKDLGLIILAEEQETTYKSENVPRYHAREVAKYRCVQAGAVLVLGSATPSLESAWLAEQRVYHCQRLTRRYHDAPLPQVLVADMRPELRRGNATISSVLRREIQQNLDRGEQTILFLNRRGNSRLVSCGECGYVPQCPRCEVPLTYHSANGRLMCHHCGHTQPFSASCPQCGGSFQFLGTGTQKLEEELAKLFPGTAVLRMDTDAVSAVHTHEKLLRRFQRERIPILLGTQMVAKGLDFENVTLVGVVDADLSLYVDDFRAAERTFSLLTQVVGRAGRGEKHGRAVIQTYTPEHEVIRFAASQDYDSFYRQEIRLRELRDYPPFCDIFVLTAAGTDEAGVLQACMILRNSLLAALERPENRGIQLRILGPAPDRVHKVNNRYRDHLTICGKNDRQTRALIAQLLYGAHHEKRMRGISVFADCNPMQ